MTDFDEIKTIFHVKKIPYQDPGKPRFRGCLVWPGHFWGDTLYIRSSFLDMSMCGYADIEYIIYATEVSVDHNLIMVVSSV